MFGADGDDNDHVDGVNYCAGGTACCKYYVWHVILCHHKDLKKKKKK